MENVILESVGENWDIATARHKQLVGNVVMSHPPSTSWWEMRYSHIHMWFCQGLSYPVAGKCENLTASLNQLVSNEHSNTKAVWLNVILSHPQTTSWWEIWYCYSYTQLDVGNVILSHRHSSSWWEVSDIITSTLNKFLGNFILSQPHPTSWWEMWYWHSRTQPVGDMILAQPHWASWEWD